MQPLTLSAIQDAFISRWGILGANWGISKTMAQIQGLLLTASEPLSTDQIMERLAISRGNAHGGIKELLEWGLARKIHKKGERKEFFEAEKDPWQIFFTVCAERRRREVQPTLDVLRNCEAMTKEIQGPEADHFLEQIRALADFVALGDRALEKISQSERSRIGKWILTLLGNKKKTN